MFKVTFKFEGAEDVITYAQEGENLLEIARAMQQLMHLVLEMHPVENVE